MKPHTRRLLLAAAALAAVATTAAAVAAYAQRDQWPPWAPWWRGHWGWAGPHAWSHGWGHGWGWQGPWRASWGPGPAPRAAGWAANTTTVSGTVAGWATPRLLVLDTGNGTLTLRVPAVMVEEGSGYMVYTLAALKPGARIEAVIARPGPWAPPLAVKIALEGGRVLYSPRYLAYTAAAGNR